MDHLDPNVAESRRQFITFCTNGQEFAADIMTIREIRGWTPTTPLPNAPGYVRGVINLRGVVLPVIDLRARLGHGMTETNAKHVIVVVRVVDSVIGLLVDAVSDIITPEASDIQPTPDLARDADSIFVEGIAVVDEKMVTILSMRHLVDSLREHTTVEAAVA
ncbi:MAG: chemotaxis protein CheW [Parvibaculum sp.]|jgi:purine-binding chemotaxis protein CheW|nr:chemotaxis protein CheW [Parvibaculum sp.]